MSKKIIIVGIIISLLIAVMVFGIIKKYNKQKIIPTIYKITLDVNGRASVLETDERGILKEPNEPYMSGGKFLGWYMGDEKVDFSKPFTQNTTIRAKWEQ